MFKATDYAFEKSKEINIMHNGKKKIYLDTKYWVDFCDIALGKREDKIIWEIYLRLKHGVASNKLICPISQRTYIEILNQTDNKSLQKSAEIIDELGLSTCIIPEDDLIRMELEYFLLKSLDKKEYNHKNLPVLDVIMNVLGLVVPTSKEKGYEWIQKAYIDQAYSTSFSEMVKKIGANPQSKIYSLEDFNRNKKIYSSDYKTLPQLYLLEIKGAIDAYKSIIFETFSVFMKNRARSLGIKVEGVSENELTPILNIMYYAFEKGTMDNDFAWLDVYAMMHAKLRWNTTQKYKHNDFNDIAHAAYALPYSDCFFTERSLHNMIGESKYDKKYKCTVASKKEDVLKIMKGMSDEQHNHKMPQLWDTDRYR